MTKTRQWSVFTVVAVVVVLLAGWILLVKPQSTKASNLRSQAATQQSNNELLVTQIASLQAEERQLPQQQQALQKFATQVPNEPAEPTMIRQLQAAAAGAGVDLVSITPGAETVVTAASEVPGSTTLSAAPTASGQLVELPLQLAITGTYPNVESFFQSLEKLPRALLVGSWSLCPDGAAAAAGGGGVACAVPATPSNKTLPPNAVGGTLSAYVFYAPPTGTTVAPATGTTTTPATTTPTTAPSTATSTAATTPPTAASSAPAN